MDAWEFRLESPEATEDRAARNCKHVNIKQQLWWFRCETCGAVYVDQEWTGVYTLLGDGVGTLESAGLIGGRDLLSAAERWVQKEPWVALLALCHACEDYHTSPDSDGHVRGWPEDHITFAPDAFSDDPRDFAEAQENLRAIHAIAKTLSDNLYDRATQHDTPEEIGLRNILSLSHTSSKQE